MVTIRAMYTDEQCQAEGGYHSGFVEVGQSKASDGKILMPETEIPHVGWSGIFSDPTGNRVALYTCMRR